MTAQDGMERLNDEARQLWFQVLEIFRPTAERLVQWLNSQEDE